jgi:hypothetical protein
MAERRSVFNEFIQVDYNIAIGYCVHSVALLSVQAASFAASLEQYCLQKSNLLPDAGDGDVFFRQK